MPSSQHPRYLDCRTMATAILCDLGITGAARQHFLPILVDRLTDELDTLESECVEWEHARDEAAKDAWEQRQIDEARGK